MMKHISFCKSMINKPKIKRKKHVNTSSKPFLWHTFLVGVRGL